MLHEWGSFVRRGRGILLQGGLQMREQEKINKDDVHYANSQVGQKFV